MLVYTSVTPVCFQFLPLQGLPRVNGAAGFAEGAEAETVLCADPEEESATRRTKTGDGPAVRAVAVDLQKNAQQYSTEGN